MTAANRRRINEKKYASWEELENGGRRYSHVVPGRHGWKARYVKEVNADEETTRFFQEIYNEKSVLVEIHHKFPVDKGHEQIAKE